MTAEEQARDLQEIIWATQIIRERIPLDRELTPAQAEMLMRNGLMIARALLSLQPLLKSLGTTPPDTRQ